MDESTGRGTETVPVRPDAPADRRRRPETQPEDSYRRRRDMVPARRDGAPAHGRARRGGPAPRTAGTPGPGAAPGAAATPGPGGCCRAGPAGAPGGRRSAPSSSRCSSRSAPPTPRPTPRCSSGPTPWPSAPTRAGAQERRPVHHPPRGGGDDPRRAGHADLDAGRGPAPRHRRGHRLPPRRPARGLRRGGGAAGRRRHQARQGHLRRRRPGRDRPQDGRGHGARHPGARHQARGPAAQRPDLEVRLAGLGAEEGPRDPGDLRAAGPPAGHEHHQVGARGPVVRDALPQGLRRDRPPGRRARAGPRGVPGQGPRADRRRPARGQDPVQRHRPAQALLLDLPEDDRAGPRLRRHLRPGRRPGPRGHPARLLRGPRRAARPLDPRARAVQGLHRDAQVQHVPVAAHDGHRAGRQARRGADPHLRDAPPGGVRRRGALEVQGHRRRQGEALRGLGQRRARRPERHVVAAPAAGLAGRDGRPRGVPRRAALRGGRPGGLRLHPARGRHVAARRLHAGRLRLRRAHRGRPPLHGRAGERPAGRRWRAGSRTATSSRSSPPRRPAPGRAGTGRRSSPRPGRATRSGSGSPRSAARRPSRPGATRWPG